MLLDETRMGGVGWGGAVRLGEGLRAADRVVADGLDAEQVLFAEKPVAAGGSGRLVSRLVTPKSAAFHRWRVFCLALFSFVVLLDLGVFVVHVQRRDDTVGDHRVRLPGVLRSPVRTMRRSKMNVMLSGRPMSRLSADDLFDLIFGDRRIEHLGQRRAIGLQDRQLVAVAGSLVVCW